MNTQTQTERRREGELLTSGCDVSFHSCFRPERNFSNRNGNLHNLRCGNEQHYFAMYLVSFYSSPYSVWLSGGWYVYYMYTLELISFKALSFLMPRVDDNDSSNELCWLLKLTLWLDFRFILVQHCFACFEIYTCNTAVLQCIPISVPLCWYSWNCFFFCWIPFMIFFQKSISCGFKHKSSNLMKVSHIMNGFSHPKAIH